MALWKDRLARRVSSVSLDKSSRVWLAAAYWPRCAAISEARKRYRKSAVSSTDGSFPARKWIFSTCSCGLANSAERAAADHCRRSEEHTSELQYLMRISYAVFCLKKKINTLDSKNSDKAQQI